MSELASEPPQKSSNRLRVLPVVLGAALASLLVLFVAAGCSAGQNTQTDSVESAVNGAHGTVGDIAIRNARFAYPADGKYPADAPAPLLLTIVNTGSSDDMLVEVTSTIADSSAAEITGDRTLPARRSLLVGSGAGTARPSSSVVATTQTPSSSVSGAPSSTTSARPTAEPVELGKAVIVFKELANPLAIGKNYAVTFVFRNAGSITLQLPIDSPQTPRPEPTGESHG